MKKLFLVGALALFAMGNAQVKFGAKTGYAMSTMSIKSGNTKVSVDPKHTFYVGGLGEFKINDNFAVQGELLFSPVGATSTDEYNIMTYNIKDKSTLNIGTLQLPISGKYYINESFALSGGLNIGFILSAKSKSQITHNLPAAMANLIPPSGETDVKKDFNSVNIAPFIGAEYNLSNGLFFDARYNAGVNDVAKDNTVTAKISFLQVGVGYKFGK